MYLLYCLTLFVFVYTAPALALSPRLIRSPHTFFLIPIVSACLVYLCVSLLKVCQIYNSPVVWGLSLVFFCIAVYRLKAEKFHLDWQFNRYDKFILLFISCLMLPYFVKLGTEAFERGDEIYSWNFWALQHLFLEPIDFSHTSATYPQLFPKLLSYCYQLLGNIQLQCPAKAMLGLFSWSLLGAFASVLVPFNKEKVLFFLVGVLYVVVGLKLEQFFNDGYADPIMSAMLVSSIAIYLHSSLLYKQRAQVIGISRYALLGLAVLIAFCAACTKQPAIMWCIAVLPCLIALDAYREKSRLLMGFSLMAVALGILWFMTEGNQFYNNQGVVYLSFEGRGYIEQLLHVSYRYLIKNPLLLALFVLTAYFIRGRHSHIIFYAFIIPQTLLWLMFGAYQLRLGQHVIAASTLLIFFSLRSKLWSARWQAWAHTLQRYRQQGIISMASVSIIACGALWAKAAFIDKPGVNFVDGGRVSLVRYFQADAQKVYDEIYLNHDALLWVPTRYLYGIFYSHTQLTTPDYLLYQSYNVQAVVNELRQKQPDFVFTVSEEVIDGPASGLLKQVIATCPQAFEVFASPPNKFEYTTFKIDHQKLANDSCLTHLAKV